MQHDIFLSYKTSDGSEKARLVKEALVRRGYRVFMYTDDQSSGKFDETLFQKIDEATDVVFILTQGVLDTCGNPGDWVGNEIRYSLSSTKNLIPLFFTTSPVPKQGELPTDLEPLIKFHGFRPMDEYWEPAMDKLASLLHSKPVIRIRRKRILFSALVLLLTAAICGSIWMLKNYGDFDMHVLAVEKQTSPFLGFQGGRLSLYIGDRLDQIHIDSSAYIRKIPGNYRGEQARLVLSAKGYFPIDTQITLGEYVTLPVRRDSSLAIIHGTVTNNKNNVPLPGVTIMVGNLSAFSDSNGHFRILLPTTMQKEEQEIIASKRGFEIWKNSQPVNSEEPTSISMVPIPDK